MTWLFGVIKGLGVLVGTTSVAYAVSICYSFSMLEDKHHHTLVTVYAGSLSVLLISALLQFLLSVHLVFKTTSDRDRFKRVLRYWLFGQTVLVIVVLIAFAFPFAFHGTTGDQESAGRFVEKASEHFAGIGEGVRSNKYEHVATLIGVVHVGVVGGCVVIGVILGEFCWGTVVMREEYYGIK